MVWVVGAIIDLFAIGAMNETGKRLPPRGSAARLVLSLALVIGLLWVVAG